jgi:periplasmic protein CpxP/Spy
VKAFAVLDLKRGKIMSLRSKLTTGLAIAVAVAAFSVVGSAQETGEVKERSVQKRERPAGEGVRRGGLRAARGFGAMRGAMAHRGFRGIELTEAQKIQINAIREANKPDEGLRQEMRSIMMAARGGTVTEAQRSRLQEIRTLQRANAENVRSQMEAVLTPEQKEKLETRRQEMQQRMEQRRQMMEQRRQQWQQRRQSGEDPADN